MVLEVSVCAYREVPPSISFSGSGFMATYQLGVAQCLLSYAPWILQTAPCVLGSSAGSLVAAAVVCEMSPIMIRDEMLNFAKEMTDYTLGPLNPSINVFHWLEFILRKHIPSDAHRMASGRLAVSMTRLSDGKEIVISEYQSKEDVVQALLCSCFVPGYCGLLPPTLNGIYYVDGGFTTMQPVLPLPSHTLTVCPFAADVDICPSDTSYMWDMVVSGTVLKGSVANTFRLINALYPMGLENLDQAYQSGYKDAINFLVSNELVPNLAINTVSHEPQDYNQNKTGTYSTLEEVEERKAAKERTKLTSFKDRKCMQMSGCASHQSTGKLPVTEPPVSFDTVTNVLMGNLVMYASMLGLPARIVSYLLLPLMLSSFALFQCRQRFMLLSRQVSEVVFWTWHCVRHFTFFFWSIFSCTLKKNIKDRVIPVFMLLQWLNIPGENEVPQGQRHTTRLDKLSPPAHCKDVKGGRVHRQGYKRAKSQNK